MVGSSRTFAPPIPTFMSVFGEETSTRAVHSKITGTHGNPVGRPASSGNLAAGSTSTDGHFPAFHIHRDSTSTLASESSDSSPTTTISTMDSSSVTDPSPGPSPESPISKATPSSFVADFRSRRTDTGSSDSSPNTFFELQRPTTPAKKPRNLKNLGINTSTSLSNLRATPTGNLPLLVNKDRNTSAPTSPSFIKPPTPPKRRPSNLSLTIQTPGSDSKPMRLVIPSTPAINRPALRHFQSSPSLPLCTPNAEPNGGMKLPALRTLKTNPHGFAEVPFEQEEEDQEPNFDIPQSREEKPAAYPNGPICIYESGVYLYFEPTAAQATEFDVIVNVASEVKNPFTSPAPDSQKDLDARRIDGPPAENVDFASLPERAKTTSFDTQSSSPTTPKATPILEPLPPREQVVNGAHTKTPEYIHMPWEHNTDIVPDLYKLVKMMDDRVKQGKRVLVHCQCGVSRSASLIVAYGLYKNPGISVQEAYDAVKKRSKWIGPNMNLIMQLQEFRNGLLRANESRAHNQGFSSARRFAGLPTSVSTGTTRPSPFDREAPTGSRTPRTAPLPPETDMNMQRASTGNMISISPGPLSAPSGSLFSSEFRRSWAPGQTDFDLSPKSSPGPLPYADPKRQVVPLLSVTDDNGLGQRTARSDSGFDVPSRGELAIPPVPNFSRQLPFRRNADSENTVASAPAAGDTESTLSVPAPPAGLEPLRSPVAPTFNIAPVVPVEKREGARHLPPKPMQFNSSTWNPVSEVRNQPRENHDDYVDPLSSPISSEFRLAGLKREETENHYELLSPTATSFNLEPGPGQQSTSANFESDDFEVSSPTISEFPKNPFARIDDSVDSGVTSPRASEFHMTPLKPSIADEDPFGLTSPTRFEFPGSCHGQQPLLTLLDPEPRRPSFQAIHPPSNLAQPEATGGFASLNGTARPQPPVVSVDISSPASSEEHPGSNPQEEPQPEPDTPKADRGAPIVPSIPIPKIPDTSFSTPLKPIGIRTRFSSPNMREQRKLHKLQTEIEAMLPGRASQPTQSVDDLDALMSPRAEEFTRNPFHFEVQSPVDDTSPASSTETIRDDQGRTEWKEISQLTPQKVVADPRSPVQAGSSPIVRNIWDVL